MGERRCGEAGRGGFPQHLVIMNSLMLRTCSLIFTLPTYSEYNQYFNNM